MLDWQSMLGKLADVHMACRELLDAARLVNAGSVAMMVYPVRSMAAVQASHQQGQQQQQSAQDARLYHGLKLKVPPLCLLGSPDIRHLIWMHYSACGHDKS